MKLPKKFITVYFLIFALIIIMLSFSERTSSKIRGNSIALFAPFWEKLLSFKYFLFNPSKPSPFSTSSTDEERQRLQLENHLLRQELGEMQKQLADRQLLAMAFTDEQKASQRGIEKINSTLPHRIKSLPARVIFRSFDTWNSSLWINAGESSNRSGEEKNIALNSPVVVGNAIVGLIDYVGRDQSRVCLISDHRLTPSVRSTRGGEQEAYMATLIEQILMQIHHKKNPFLTHDESTQLEKLLVELKNKLNPLKRSWYLAKGQLKGSSSPSYHFNPQVTLKGTGFNYDFADREGDPRDLRTGRSLLDAQAAAIAILKIDDILITTGMDGIFPPGFQVARVKKIGLLKEGDYFYDLEAEPIVGHLEELSLVFVLPPIKKQKYEIKE